ncbi:MAG: hypothetical protein IIA67_03595 [Planctomycetes bacterium]|nr:hypothetical protein [Planctomycetota bacterium]
MCEENHWSQLQKGGELLAKRLGADPAVFLACQDWQYTSADSKQLDQYLALYRDPATTDCEKKALACFILQSLDDLAVDDKMPTDADSLVALLAADGDLHRYELAYWACWGASETDEQWRISPLLRQHVNRT